MTYRVLDLLCGGGGSAMGLHRAWPDAEIVGVDCDEQPEYPFEFRRADALTYPLAGFDFIWASPVCKGYSALNSMWNANYHARLIGEVRKRLEPLEVPYVIENVTGARRQMHPQLMLCGQMFGLKVFRHRWFESNRFLWSLPHAKHDGRTGTHRYPYSPIGGYVQVTGVVNSNYTIPQAQAAMGIDWIHDAMIAQAIPPAYSFYIAKQIRQP